MFRFQVTRSSILVVNFVVSFVEYRGRGCLWYCDKVDDKAYDKEKKPIKIKTKIKGAELPNYILNFVLYYSRC